LPEYLLGNVEAWQKRAVEFAQPGEDAWADPEWAAQWPAEEVRVVRRL
jgi:hypothetical protein